MSKLYNEDSIESLSPLEFTRLRPGVYAGDTTYSTQLLVEIISNAVDEFRLGHFATFHGLGALIGTGYQRYRMKILGGVDALSQL